MWPQNKGLAVLVYWLVVRCMRSWRPSRRLAESFYNLRGSHEINHLPVVSSIMLKSVRSTVSTWERGCRSFITTSQSITAQ